LFPRSHLKVLLPWRRKCLTQTYTDQLSADFGNRREEITKQLLEAAEYAGFFTLVDHGISEEEIESQFAISKSYFGLPADVKGKIPHDTKTNNGWEYKVRRLSERIGDHLLTAFVTLGSTAGEHRDL
jgi:isopenicillin N synthase-like dioxygenase